MPVFIFSLVFIIALGSAAYAADCGGDVDCACGDTLTSSRTINETDALAGCAANGIMIGASNLLLDCDGYNITGLLGADSMGIVIPSSFANITVKNCNISNFTYGIMVGGENVTITLNTIQNNSNSALYISGSTKSGGNGLRVLGNSLLSSGNGITIENINITLDGTISNNTIMHNNNGIYASGITNVCNGSGCMMLEIWQNDIYGNTFGVAGNSSSIQGFNLNHREGMGMDESYYGNYWGHTDHCPYFRDYDLNDSGTSSGMLFDGDAYDSPIANAALTEPKYCLTCGTGPSSQLMSGNNYIDDNVYNTSGGFYCGEVAVNIGNNNTALYCNGYSINGTYPGNNIGISISGVNNITISNCTIFNFTYGIFSEGTNVTITSDTVHDCDTGVNIVSGGDYIIWHNNLYNNTEYSVNSSISPLELSNGSEGNFWGRTSCPVFVAGEDTNDADVKDSYAYNSLSGWLTGSPTVCDSTPPEVMLGVDSESDNNQPNPKNFIGGENVTFGGYVNDTLSGIKNWSLELWQNDAFDRIICNGTNAFNASSGDDYFCSWNSTTFCPIGNECENITLILHAYDNHGNENDISNDSANMSNFVVDNKYPVISDEAVFTFIYDPGTQSKSYNITFNSSDTYLRDVNVYVLNYSNYTVLVWYSLCNSSQEECNVSGSGEFLHTWQLNRFNVWHQGNSYPSEVHFQLLNFEQRYGSSPDYNLLPVPGCIDEDGDGGFDCGLEEDQCGPEYGGCTQAHRWWLVFNVSSQTGGGALAGITQENWCMDGCIINTTIIQPGNTKFKIQSDKYLGDGEWSRLNSTNFTLNAIGNAGNPTLNSTNPDGPHNFLVQSSDYVWTSDSLWIDTLYADFNSPQIDQNTTGTNDTDMFYSPYRGVVHILANVSDQSTLNVTADLSNISSTACANGDGTLNLSYNATTGLWEGACDISSFIAANTEPDSRFISISAVDEFYNSWSLTPAFQILVHDLGVPSESDPCIQFGSKTTNLSLEENFAEVNFIFEIEVNLSCAAGMPFLPSNYRKGAMINISSVDISTQEASQKLQQLGSALQIDIQGPETFGESRIYINSTFFAELNKTATLALYNLPFTSKPNVSQDPDSAGISSAITWATNGYDSELDTITGNLTFNVNGFSGYNASDNIAPTVTINYPLNQSNISASSILINITANGTGSEISNVIIVVDGVQHTWPANFTCNESFNGSEVVNCILNKTLPEMQHSLMVIVNDYGPEPNGNNASTQIGFTNDITPPNTTDNETGQWHTADYTITLTPSDTNTGVKNTTYKIDAGSWQLGNSISINTEGNHTVQYYSTDYAGNAEGIHTINALLDKTKPTISLNGPAPGLVYNQPTGFTVINFTPTDNLDTNLSCMIFINSALNTTVMAANGTAYEFSQHYADGTYIWHINCSDDAGNSNISGTRNFSVDTVPPQVSIVSPANGYNSTSKQMTLVCGASDAGLKNVTLYHNATGWAENQTNTSGIEGPYSFTVTLEDGEYKWNCLACDIINNCNWSAANYTFKIDSTGPAVTSPAVSPSTAKSSASVQVNATVTDASAIASVTVNGTAMSVLSGNVYSITSTGTALGCTADGACTLGFNATDIFGNSNSSVTTVLTIDNTPPAVTGISKSAAIAASSTNFQVNITVNDSNAIISVSVKNGSSIAMVNLTLTTYSVTTNGTALGCTEGTCTLTFTATDEAGNANGSVTTSIIIDDTAPLASLTSPANGASTNNASIGFACSATDANMANVTLYHNATGTLAANSTNASGVSGAYTFTVSMADGVTKWNCLACDLLGRCAWAASNYTFTLDTSKPSVTSPAVSSALVKSSTSIQVNATVTDLSSVTVTVNGVAMSAAGSNVYTATTTGASLGCAVDGVCTLRINATDSFGNYNDSVTTAITVDDSGPAVTGPALSRTVATGTTNVQINVTAADTYSGVANVSASGGSPVAMANVTLTKYTVTTNGSALGCAEGACTITFTALDGLGNTNNTVTTTLNIDNTAPALSGATANATKFKSAASVRVDVTVSDANLQMVYLNNTAMSNTSATAWYITGTVASLFGSAEGAITKNFTAVDAAGNWNNATTITITVDDTPPTISSVSDSPGSSSATISWTANEAANGRVDYNENGTATWASATTASYSTSVSVSLSSLNSTSLYYYNVTSCDEAGNCNTSTGYNFTTTAPSAPSSGGGGGGSSTTYTASISPGTVQTFNMRPSDRVFVSIRGETHTITVSSYSSTHASIIIASTPTLYTLTLNEPLKIDTNKDGYYDLIAEYKGTSGGRLNIEFSYIYEKIEEEAVPEAPALPPAEEIIIEEEAEVPAEEAEAAEPVPEAAPAAEPAPEMVEKVSPAMKILKWVTVGALAIAILIAVIQNIRERRLRSRY